jgi:cytoskeletal protein CcmA (bactofilin family)
LFKKSQTEVQAVKSLKKDSKDFAVAIITEGCNFEGKLYCKGATRIGGKVDGEIISEGLLIVEDSANLKADITAEDIIIQGSIHGNLSSNGRVELSPTSVFEGSIKTNSLVIQEGAKFNGTTSMNLNSQKSPSVGNVAKSQKSKDKNVEVGDIAVNESMSSKAPEVKLNL